jgi:FkbH-like protein
MKFYAFRNSTIEPLFAGYDISFSGYGDISKIDPDAETYIWFYTLPLKADQSKICEEINNYQNSFNYLLNNLKNNKNFLAFTISEISVVVYEMSNNPVKEAVNRFNNLLLEESKAHPNIKVIDFATFTREYPPEVLIDWKYYYLSLMVINPRLSKAFVCWFNTQLDSIALRRKKCLVLDLDNTLWGGILGEDGIQNIRLGGQYPGNAFADFQAGLLELSRKGILLTICSKNNESDVEDVWKNLPGMILKREDFSAFRINWKDKANNIEELAKELNIGLDSFVFIDDNPTERELIKGMLPAVEVPDFPEHPYGLTKFFKSLVEKYFTVYKLTDEDLLKTQQYKENAQRTELKRTFTNFEEYIKNLEIEMSVIQANEFNITRIAQMTQKTNQFNLTTKRYSDADIRAFIIQGTWVRCISVKDRFGDNGLTGLLILKFDQSKEIAVIDTFLMSCRILGRKIENEFLAYILNNIFKQNFSEVRSYFTPSQKNEQVINFYEEFGFAILEKKPDGKKIYSLKKENYKYTPSNNYKISEL